MKINLTYSNYLEVLFVLRFGVLYGMGPDIQAKKQSDL